MSNYWVKTGTIEFQNAGEETIPNGYTLFVGEIEYDGYDPLVVWDTDNLRVMTTPEKNSRILNKKKAEKTEQLKQIAMQKLAEAHPTFISKLAELNGKTNVDIDGFDPGAGW